jgi:hypothetical protein
MQLFFNANSQSTFLNPTLMKASRDAGAKLAAAGIVPLSGVQRWEDTWEAALPASNFPGEPSAIAVDRLNANGQFGGGKVPLDQQPEYSAWATFVLNHPQYWDVANDGGTMPNAPNSYRSWNSQWGHISPLTPLDQADCPPDMPSGCTWGDSWAYRWGQTAAVDGSQGVQLSDFSDSQPHAPNFEHDFNPRIVAAFAAQYGYLAQLSGLSTPQQAAWINANAFPQWTDYLSAGYAHFYEAIATRIGAKGQPALILDQCSNRPSFRRLSGTDQRIFSAIIDPHSYICTWDNQSIQIGRGGPIANPPMQELAGGVIAAARTPTVRNGQNMESPDAAFWNSIAHFYPTLSAATQQEVGLKLAKRLWLWEAWAHIADGHGHVRRALALWDRDYWDAGSLAQLDPLTTLISTIVPTRPFGAALYYSVSVERSVEASEKKGPGLTEGYLPQSQLQQFIDAGGGFGYYVSDAALAKINPSAGNVPSAWVVIGAGNALPAAELRALQATAPVVTTPQQLAALPNQPFKASAPLSAFAFRDQNNRIIAVISNPSTLPTATSVSGTVAFAGLATGRYQVTNLFTNQTTTVVSANGTLTLPVTLTRWDTAVLAIAAL